MTQTTNDAIRDEALAQLRQGTTALNEGRLEQAAEALVDAEVTLRQLGDHEHAGDSRSALAEVRRRGGRRTGDEEL